MNFDSYTAESSKGMNYKIETVEELPDFYTDPYLRRYFIFKYVTEACLVSLSVWGIKNIAQNLSAKRFKKVSPWLELSLGFFYLDQQLFKKFA